VPVIKVVVGKKADTAHHQTLVEHPVLSVIPVDRQIGGRDRAEVAQQRIAVPAIDGVTHSRNRSPVDDRRGAARKVTDLDPLVPYDAAKVQQCLVLAIHENCSVRCKIMKKRSPSHG
jgi:hypothetical protein